MQQERLLPIAPDISIHVTYCSCTVLYMGAGDSALGLARGQCARCGWLVHGRTEGKCVCAKVLTKGFRTSMSTTELYSLSFAPPPQLSPKPAISR